MPAGRPGAIALVDFNEETLLYTGRKINEVQQRYHRKTPVKLVPKNSVQNLLRTNPRQGGGGSGDST